MRRNKWIHFFSCCFLYILYRFNEWMNKVFKRVHKEFICLALGWIWCLCVKSFMFFAGAWRTFLSYCRVFSKLQQIKSNQKKVKKIFNLCWKPWKFEICLGKFRKYAKSYSHPILTSNNKELTIHEMGINFTKIKS